MNAKFLFPNIENEYVKIQENYQKFLIIEQQIQEHPESVGDLIEKNEAIKTVTITGNIQKISKRAFYMCGALC